MRNATQIITNAECGPRRSKHWEPRVAAIEIVGEGVAWGLRLTERATYLELALLRLAYAAELTGEDETGMLLTPREGIPCPTREHLVETVLAIHERRPPNRRC